MKSLFPTFVQRDSTSGLMHRDLCGHSGGTAPEFHGIPFWLLSLYESLRNLLISFNFCCGLCLAVDMSGQPMAVIKYFMVFVYP